MRESVITNYQDLLHISKAYLSYYHRQDLVAEDMVQEAVIRALTLPPPENPEDNIRYLVTYLITSIKRAIRDGDRKRRTERQYVECHPKTSLVDGCRITGEGEIDLRAARLALDSISPKLRDTLRECLLHDASTLAEKNGMSKGACYVKKHRVLKTVREKYRELRDAA